MKRSSSENWFWMLLTCLACGLVILCAWITLNEAEQNSDAASTLASRHQSHTLKAARAIEAGQLLILKSLAQAADSAPGDGKTADFLRTTHSRFDPEAVPALVLLSAGGQLLGQHPPTALADLGLSPEHLAALAESDRAVLPGTENAPLTPLRLTLAANPQHSLLALVSLRALIDQHLARITYPLELLFLLDEQGTILLHNTAGLTGRQAESVYAASAEMRQALTAMRRGEQDAVFMKLKTPADVSRRVIVGYCSIRGVSGSRILALTPTGALRGAATAEPGLPLQALGALALAALLAGLCVEGRRRFRLKCLEILHLSREVRLHQTASEKHRNLYRHLLDNAGDALFFIDPQSGGLLQMNVQTEKLLLYDVEELREQTLSILFPGRHHRRYLSLVKRVLEQGYGEANDLCFRRKDGSTFVGAVHARLGKLGAEEVVHGVLRDVSGLKRIENELRQKNRDLTLLNEMAHQVSESRDLKEMLCTILSSLTEAFSMDGGGIYLHRDNGATLNLEAHLGIYEALLPELRSLPPGKGLLGQVSTTGQPRSSANLSKDRRLYIRAVREAGWRSLQAIPLVSREKTLGVLFLFSLGSRVLAREEISLLLAVGRQVGTAVEGADLMDALRWQVRLTQASNRELQHSRKQLRESLSRMAEANQALERIDRMKTSFLSLASHELRTPLTYVISGAQLLESTLEGRATPEEQRVLEAISQGGRRLEQIVQDLLEAARLEASSIYLACEPVDLGRTLQELYGQFIPRTKARHIELVLDPLPGDLLIQGDTHHLAKTLSRLLENALKFTPQDGRVTISARPVEASEILARREALEAFSPNFFRQALCARFIQVSVTDSGVGIDAEDQVRVFDKFYEVGDIAHHFTSCNSFGGKGVGMGLALVKGMVEAHGGMVWVESPGTGAGGSRFHVLLPQASQEEPAPSQVRETYDENDPLFSGYSIG